MPLFWISLAFLCGILLSPSLSLPILGWSLLALLALILSLPPILHRLSSRFSPRFTQLTEALKLSSPALYPLTILFLSLGAIRYQLNQPTIDPSFIAYYNDQTPEYIIEAVVAEPPDVCDTYVNLRLRIEQIHSVDANQFILSRVSF